jgi:hypothetical protein
MRLYVESNFVLELAFEQERHGICEQVLGYVEDGSLGLVLPAYCLAEPYETLGRRHNMRQLPNWGMTCRPDWT